jgi:hypothetical protein
MNSIRDEKARRKRGGKGDKNVVINYLKFLPVQSIHSICNLIELTPWS